MIPPIAAVLLAQALVGSAGTVPGPIALTDEQRRETIALLETPEAMYLRNLFSRHAKRAVDGAEARSLSGFDRTYFKSPFILVQVAPFLGGGRVLSIVFVDKPDRMFDCWVYALAPRGYELRAFSEDTSFTEKEIRIVYRNLLKDPALRR